MKAIKFSFFFVFTQVPKETASKIFVFMLLLFLLNISNLFSCVSVYFLYAVFESVHQHLFLYTASELLNEIPNLWLNIFPVCFFCQNVLLAIMTSATKMACLLVGMLGNADTQVVIKACERCVYWFVCIIVILRWGAVRKSDFEREGWMRESECGRGRDEEG